VRQVVKRTRGGPLGLSTTRRAAMLATVVCALALSVAVPLRTYLAQRSDVQIQEQRQAELRRQVGELEQRKAQLADPAQVQAEAKRRLRYVMPGETPYMVELPAEAGGSGSGQQSTHPISQQAWYQALWQSVHGAGQ
jgi:cell division protein FtsB